MLRGGLTWNILELAFRSSDAMVSARSMPPSLVFLKGSFTTQAPEPWMRGQKPKTRAPEASTRVRQLRGHKEDTQFYNFQHGISSIFDLRSLASRSYPGKFLGSVYHRAKGRPFGTSEPHNSSSLHLTHSEL